MTTACLVLTQPPSWRMVSAQTRFSCAAPEWRIAALDCVMSSGSHSGKCPARTMGSVSLIWTI